MNCYIYARVSSIGDWQSTERQVKFLTELASSKGYEVKGIYEEHISGATSNKERKVLADCLNDAKENCIDLILFSELSRCGRAIWEVSETIKFCADNGINLHFPLLGSTGEERVLPLTDNDIWHTLCFCDVRKTLTTYNYAFFTPLFVCGYSAFCCYDSCFCPSPKFPE